MLCALLPAGCKRQTAIGPGPASVPATTRASTQAAPSPAGSYVDLIRRSYPSVAATQPLALPLDLNDAGHFVLNQPIYLCPRGDLWITAVGAPSAADVLKNATDEQIHLTAEQVVFVHWAADEQGKWMPQLVTRGRAGAYEWIDTEGNKKLPTSRPYHWDRAQSWGNRVVVPTENGVSIISTGSELSESYHQLVPPDNTNRAQFQFDPRGVLAWCPWETAKIGSNGAARFVDGQWTLLDDKAGWPPRLLHLVPLLDGSVLQLVVRPDNKITPALAALDTVSADEKQIAKLVEQLSDADPAKRNAAFSELTRYGTASWPILEKLLEDQPPEAQIRMHQLLQNRIQPTLGGRTLVDGNVRVIEHFNDGGVLLYAAAGVRIPRENTTPEVVKPAWITIRPGRAIELLDEVLVHEADPAKQHFAAFGDEWLVTDFVAGPRRLMGNHLEAMLRTDELAFWQPVGVDRRGRWLFHKPTGGSETLIIDPTVPDPTPRLPVWLLDVKEGGAVGWQKDNWPVIKRGGAWVLQENSWQPLDEKKDAMITVAPAPSPAPPTTSPATTQALGPVILVDKDGRKYYDGHKMLRLVERSGREIVWPLPATATGTGKVTLLQAKDATLFLFNSPGRVLRIKRQENTKSPFVLEATFTHRIPNVDNPTRIWIDPAGRIIEAHDTHLAIMFPEGRIPQHLATLIPAAELEEQRGK